MTDHMEPFRMELKRLHERIDGMSRFEWAQVTSVSPLRIHFAGDNNPVAVPPDTMAATLMVGDMVRVERKGAHMTIHGVGKGADNPRHFSSKAALDLWMPIDGTHAWVVRDARQYLRTGGTWRAVLEDSGWTNLSLAAGVTGTVRYRVLNRVAHFEVNVTTGSVAGGAATAIASEVPASHRPAVPYAALNLFRGNYFEALAPGVVSAWSGELSIRNTSDTAYAGVWMGTGSYALT